MPTRRRSRRTKSRRAEERERRPPLGSRPRQSRGHASSTRLCKVQRSSKQTKDSSVASSGPPSYNTRSRARALRQQAVGSVSSQRLVVTDDSTSRPVDETVGGQQAGDDSAQLKSLKVHSSRDFKGECHSCVTGARLACAQDERDSLSHKCAKLLREIEHARAEQQEVGWFLPSRTN